MENCTCPTCRFNRGEISKEALAWYKSAANTSIAQYRLGEIYYKGELGVKKNYEDAFYWLSKSAEKGHMDAYKLLAECYLLGRGVKPNPIKAKKYRDLYHKAEKDWELFNKGFSKK